MMKNEMEKLNSVQLQELREITELLTGQYQVDKLICFGALNNNTALKSCFADPVDRGKNHYFLLMVTKEVTRMEHDAQDYVNTHYAESVVTIISHGRKTIEDAIIKGSRFFITVYLEGYLLYSADGMPLFFKQKTLPVIDPAATPQKAKKHYASRWTMACGFAEAAAICKAHAFYNNAAYLLHQAVEQTCIALIRVFTGYRADLHNLGKLLKLCLCCCPDIALYFAMDTSEQQRLFKLLNNSYARARYTDDFSVSGEDTEVLTRLVDDFMVMADTLCQHRIAGYETLAGVPNEAVMDYTPGLTEIVLNA